MARHIKSLAGPLLVRLCMCIYVSACVCEIECGGGIVCVCVCDHVFEVDVCISQVSRPFLFRIYSILYGGRQTM